MTKAEAKRHAHKLIADVINNMTRPTQHTMHVNDAVKVNAALDEMRETHQRFGPRTTDKPPRPPIYKGEKLAFDPPPLSAADRDTMDVEGPHAFTPAERIECGIPEPADDEDPGDAMCRCNGRLPHAPGAVGPNNEACALSTLAPASLEEAEEHVRMLLRESKGEDG